jgi:tellurite resistance protein TerC
MEVSSSFWIGFIILVIALLSLDMFLFNRKGTVIDVKRALWLSLFWISLAFIFNVGVYMVFGKESALEFFTAYLVEESLSIDNLFVFIIIFSAFKIKPEHQHTVLFWGICRCGTDRTVCLDHVPLWRIPVVYWRQDDV